MARTPAKKTLADFERQRAKRNERQKQYRLENPELYSIWRQRSYANFLRDRGWKVVEPPNFSTLEQVRTKRDLLRQLELDEPPIDLSTLGFDDDIDPDEIDIDPDDLPY